MNDDIDDNRRSPTDFVGSQPRHASHLATPPAEDSAGKVKFLFILIPLTDSNPLPSQGSGDDDSNDEDEDNGLLKSLQHDELLAWVDKYGIAVPGKHTRKEGTS
jgi:hypothetical protein